jgi:hypothetical protein
VPLTWYANMRVIGWVWFVSAPVVLL